MRPNTIVVDRFCDYKLGAVVPAVIHNLRNPFDFDNRIWILEKMFRQPKLKILDRYFGEKEVRCPSGNLKGRFINYNPGRENFDSYLKGYFKEE